MIKQYFDHTDESNSEDIHEMDKMKDKLKEIFRGDFQDLPTSALHLLEVSIEPDNVWLEIQIDQNFADGMSIPKLINSLKSVTARYLANSFPELKSDDNGIWNPGYFIATKGSFLEHYIDQYLDQLISLTEIMQLYGLGIDTGIGKKKAYSHAKQITKKNKGGARHT